LFKNPHIAALIVTLVAVVAFLLLKPILHFQFGLRTYWPAFFVGYLLVWYYGRILREAGKGGAG
jgi:hypothetical protein